MGTKYGPSEPLHVGYAHLIVLYYPTCSVASPFWVWTRKLGAVRGSLNRDEPFGLTYEGETSRGVTLPTDLVSF